MHVNRRANAVVAQRLTNRRAKAEVGDEVVVHHVKMDDVRPGGKHGGDILTQTGKIGGENRGGNQGRQGGHKILMFM